MTTSRQPHLTITPFFPRGLALRLGLAVGALLALAGCDAGGPVGRYLALDAWFAPPGAETPAVAPPAAAAASAAPKPDATVEAPPGRHRSARLWWRVSTGALGGSA